MTINKKGFTYIIIVVILISLITVLVLLIKEPLKIEKNAPKLTENYIQELNYLLDSNYTLTDINNFNANFYDYIRAHNFEIKLCTLIENGTKVYISNYTGEIQKGVEHKQTIEILREQNPGNLSISNCVLDYNSDIKISYYIEIRNQKTKNIVYLKGNNVNDSNFVLE